MSIVGNTFCNPLTTPVADIVPFRQSLTFWYPEQTQRRNWETASIIGNTFCNPLTTPVADIAPFRQSLTFWISRTNATAKFRKRINYWKRFLQAFVVARSRYRPFSTKFHLLISRTNATAKFRCNNTTLHVLSVKICRAWRTFRKQYATANCGRFLSARKRR